MARERKEYLGQGKQPKKKIQKSHVASCGELYIFVDEFLQCKILKVCFFFFLKQLFWKDWSHMKPLESKQ